MSDSVENIAGQPDLSQTPGQHPPKTVPADQSIDETLDATITYLEGLPTGVDIQSAIENIQDWQQKLQSFNRPELTQLVTELGSLIKYLSAPEPDKASISRSLIQLGNHIATIAPEAEGSTGDKLKTLSHWLQKIGETL